MARSLLPHRLNRVARANKELIQHWDEGLSLTRASGREIKDLVRAVSAGRWGLARVHFLQGDRLLAGKPPRYRGAISSYYYAMYHAMRACVFICHGGDDHESHTDLPLHIPSDFPPAGWQTKLKDARLARNQADYDPYPTGAKQWEPRSKAMRIDADLLLGEARAYLRSRGCQL